MNKKEYRTIFRVQKNTERKHSNHNPFHLLQLTDHRQKGKMWNIFQISYLTVVPVPRGK